MVNDNAAKTVHFSFKGTVLGELHCALLLYIYIYIYICFSSSYQMVV